jgi:hypothetical protein
MISNICNYTTVWVELFETVRVRHWHWGVPNSCNLDSSYPKVVVLQVRFACGEVPEST